MNKTPHSRRELMQEYAAIMERMASFGFHGQGGYAEILVAEALGGTRATGSTKGHDVIAPDYGRIEVKCRVLPRGGGSERRAEIGKGKEQGFDYLALVVFDPGYNVQMAVLVPYSSVWVFTRTTYRNRVRSSEALGLVGAVDITDAVSRMTQK